MPSPQMTVGAYGNLIDGISVAAGATIGAYLPNSGTDIETQLSAEFTTGTTAPAASIIFSAYKVSGGTGTSASAAAETTLSASASAGASSLSVTAATGINNVAQLVALQNASSPYKGEVVQVASVSGTTVTLKSGTTTINAYSSGDYVYLIDQTAAFAVAPGSSWAASTEYSGDLFLPTARWFVAADNTSAQSVTVYATYDRITAYA